MTDISQSQSKMLLMSGTANRALAEEVAGNLAEECGMRG